MTRQKPRAQAASPHDALLTRVSQALDGEAYAAAVDLLTDAIATAPEDAALHHCRGAVHVLATVQWPAWASGNEEKREASLRAAVADLDRAIALRADYAEAHLNRGLAWRLLADRKRSDADLSRALELGLEPVLALQAYSERGAEGDVAIVNTMRKARGMGNAWRESTPQRVTLHGVVPPSATTPKAASPAAPPTPPTRGPAPGEAVDWPEINRRADRAYKDAVKAHAAGKGGPAPDDARVEAWMEGFPAQLRPGIRVFFAAPRPDDPWAAACKLGDEVALAKAIVGREHPPFVDTRFYLTQAARALRDEPAFLAKVADDFLRQIDGIGRYQMGQEHMLAQLRELVPGSVLSPGARAIADKLSANKKYQPIAAALRAWAGLAGKPTALRRAQVDAAADAGADATVAAFEALTQEIVETDALATLKKLHRRVEKLDLLEALDEPAHRKRVEACIKKLSARAKALPGAAGEEVANILDTATST